MSSCQTSSKLSFLRLDISMRFRRNLNTKRYVRTLLAVSTIVFVFHLPNNYVSKEEEACSPRELKQELYQQILRNYSRYISHTPDLFNTTYDIIFLVLTKHDDYSLRKQIRKTWANRNNSKLLRTSKAVVLFLIGRGDEDTVIVDSTFNDIIQVNVEEKYRNLVYKELIAFSLLIDHFPSAYMVKVDGVDTAVDIDRFHKHLPDNYKDVITCRTREHVRVNRNQCHKWYIPETILENQYFPRYCSGPAYGLSIESLKKIMQVANRSKVFEIEDAFYTGVLAEAASITRMDMPSLIDTHCDTGIFSFLKNGRLACGAGTGITTSIVATHHCQDASLRYAMEWLRSSKCRWL